MRAVTKPEPGGVLRLFLFIALLLATQLSAVAARIESSDEETLFSPAAARRAGSDPAVVRTRFVTVNRDLLEGLEVGDAVRLNLFDGVAWTAVFDSLSSGWGGGRSWTGHVEGVPHSLVTLVEWKGMFAGDIVLPGADYQVRHAGDGVYAVHQIDQAAFPPEAEPVAIPSSLQGAEASTAVPAVDTGAVIDVLVVYTAEARQAAGGTAEIEALINLAVAETNASYANSLISQRLNLVYMDEVAYSESDLDWYDTLDHLRTPADGYLDRVHTLRDACAPTMLCLLLLTPLLWSGLPDGHRGGSFESWAFGLVSHGCAVSSHSFAHELGHNMGAIMTGTSTTPWRHFPTITAMSMSKESGARSCPTTLSVIFTASIAIGCRIGQILTFSTVASRWVSIPARPPSVWRVTRPPGLRRR